jgi:AcrR family transcriptional regulator
MPPESYRQRQARATRHAVARAARRLFAARGYRATTIEAIAGESQIPAPTIYSAFGGKAAILEQVRLDWIAESSVAELHAQALAVADPRERLAMAAHWTRRQFDLGYDIITVHAEAAGADPNVATSWSQAMDGRERAIAQLVAPLSQAEGGRLPAKRAVDVYVALTRVEIYRELVAERGWTSQEFEEWLTGALQSALLAPRRP